MRLRRAITGVRGRLVVALVATSAVTLAVAGGAGRRLHLAPLRHQALALELRTGAGEIAAASEQSARLGRLASDLLDLSRIERGLELRSEPVDLVEVCRAVLAEFDTLGRSIAR
jgi:signal transduction histidine kinase